MEALPPVKHVTNHYCVTVSLIAIAISVSSFNTTTMHHYRLAWGYRVLSLTSRKIENGADYPRSHCGQEEPLVLWK
jgi:hypothetical protein